MAVSQKSKAVTVKSPDIEYLLALKQELSEMYADQDRQISASRQMAEMTFAVPVDDAHRLCDIEIRDSTIADERLRAVATLTINPFHVEVTPARPVDVAQHNATLRSKFSEEVMRVSGTRTPGVDTYSAAVDACSGDGGAWTKFLFTHDIWDARYAIKLPKIEKQVAAAYRKGRDKDEAAVELETEMELADISMLAADKFNELTEDAKKAAGPPFTWVCCDTLSIYPVYRGGKLAEMLEIQQRPRSSTFRQYRLGYNADGAIVPEELAQGGAQRGPKTVTYMELWTDEECIVAIVGDAGSNSGGQIVKRWKHRYGQVPYFFAPGLQYNYWRNRKVGWSIGQTKAFLVQYRSFLWTLHAQVAYRDALPTIVRETTNPDQTVIGVDGMPTGEARNNEHWNPREIINLAPGEKLTPLQFPPVAASLREEIQLISEAIDRLDTPRVQSNIGSGMEGAGFAINQILTEAKTRFNPIVLSLEAMIRDVIKFMWKLIRTVVEENVWVYRQSEAGGWLCAGKDDLADTVAMSVHLDPEQPSAKLIETRYWNERVQGGTCSLDQAIEGQGGSPDEVNRGKAVDRMRKTDWYIKLQDQAVLDQGGLGDLTKQAQQIAQTGILPGMPGGGVPGMPPGMAAPVGMAGMSPDPGNLALSPSESGANPMPGPANGSVSGAGPGMVIPTQGAAAGIQSINTGV